MIIFKKTKEKKGSIIKEILIMKSSIKKNLYQTVKKENFFARRQKKSI